MLLMWLYLNYTWFTNSIAKTIGKTEWGTEKRFTSNVVVKTVGFNFNFLGAVSATNTKMVIHCL